MARKQGARSRRGAGKKKKRTLVARWTRRLLLFLAGLLLGLLGPWLWWLDHFAGQRFADRHLQEASRVYARPLELYSGLRLSREDLIVELEAAGLRAGSYHQSGRFELAGEVLRIHVPAFLFPDGAQAAQQVVVTLTPQGLQLDGSSLLRLPPAELGRILPLDERVRSPLKLQELPPLLLSAAQAVEDRRFKHHRGVDVLGMARAGWANLRAGRVVQGGSTITQQLVKNLYLSPERSWLRKFNELVMALSLERRFSKAEILEAWFNEVYLGDDGRRPIHGFGRAAEYYFGQPPASLDAGQIALLVGMVRGASWYHPLRNPERARQRRDRVLAMMVETGLISPEEQARQQAAGLGLRPSLSTGARPYAAFMDLVGRQLRADYRDRDLRDTGLRIFTTLSPSAQRHAERVLAHGLDRVETEPGSLQGALVLADPVSGELAALVGGRQQGGSGFNRALDARRQVGSIIKPLVYLLALDDPARFTLLSSLEDAPLTVELPGQAPWQPVNHDGRYLGELPLLEALAQSRNVASVRLGLAVGVDALFALMRQLGVNPAQQAHPSALLGAVELSPLQVTQLYQPLAAGGYSTPLRAVREVMDARGQIMARYPTRLKPLPQRQALELLDFALQRAVYEGTGRAQVNRLPTDRRVRGKTGTTNQQRDAWFAGYEGRWLAVVWVGRDDNAAAGIGGAGTALPVWAELMRHLPGGQPVRPTVDGVEWFWVDWPQPLLATEDCEQALAVPFIAGSQPRTLSDCVASGHRRR